MNMHATIEPPIVCNDEISTTIKLEELLETVYSGGADPRMYDEDPRITQFNGDLKVSLSTEDFECDLKTSCLV